MMRCETLWKDTSCNYKLNRHQNYESVTNLLWKLEGMKMTTYNKNFKNEKLTLNCHKLCKNKSRIIKIKKSKELNSKNKSSTVILDLKKTRWILKKNKINTNMNCKSKFSKINKKEKLSLNSRKSKTCNFKSDKTKNWKKSYCSRSHKNQKKFKNWIEFGKHNKINSPRTFKKLEYDFHS